MLNELLFELLNELLKLELLFELKSEKLLLELVDGVVVSTAESTLVRLEPSRELRLENLLVNDAFLQVGVGLLMFRLTRLVVLRLNGLPRWRSH